MTLDELFIKYGSDKSSLHHSYSGVYEEILEPLRIHPIVLLELGVGGYEYTDRGGGCIKAFDAFLPYSLILGVDLYDKSFLNKKDKIQTYVASQDDDSFFRQLRGKVGNFDVIIDDASHVNSLTIKSFQLLFPMVKSGGTYVVEDIEGSWYEEHGFGGCKEQNNFEAETTVNYFRKLTNSLNSKFIENYKQIEVFEDTISSISFSYNMIVIKKK